MIPHLPPGVSDRNLEDDQHAALSESEFRAAQERDMQAEEKREGEEIDRRAMQADDYEDRLKDRRLGL